MTDVATATLTDLFAAADTINLADVEHAALLTRVDRKYALDPATAEAVVGRLAPRSAVMTIDGRHTFWYRSVYFDTPDLESYRRAATRRRLRWKVRTRSYVESGAAYVEVKQGGTRGVTEKQRIALPLDSTPSASDRSAATQSTRCSGGPGSPPPSTRCAPRPTQRTTLVDLDSTTDRATIDTSVALGGAEAAQLVIVEVKARTGSSWFDRVLRGRALVRNR